MIILYHHEERCCLFLLPLELWVASVSCKPVVASFSFPLPPSAAVYLERITTITWMLVLYLGVYDCVRVDTGRWRRHALEVIFPAPDV